MVDKLDDIIEQELRAKDIAVDLGNLLRGIESTGNKLVDNLLDSSRQIISFDNVLKHVLKTMKGLPEHVLTTNDLQKEMLKDAKLFGQVQTHSNDLVAKSVEEIRKTVNNLNTEMSDTSQVFEQGLMAVEDVSQNLTEDFDLQFKLLQRQVGVTDELSDNFIDVKKTVDDIGSVIRNPAQGAEGLLSTISQFPRKFIEAREDGESFGGALGKVWNNSGMSKFIGMIGKGGPLVIGIVAATAVATVMWTLFKNFWDFMDKKIIPATAEFNKQIGGSGKEVGKLKKQTMAAGVQFELLGLSFEEGAAKVRELAIGMKTVALDPKTLKTGMELQAILGLTGDEVGALGLQFTKSTGNLDGLNEMLSAGKKEAEAYGLPINAVLKDMATSPDILARFGTANRMAFKTATVEAQTYGFSIKEVTAAFGKQMDTFEGTAEASAKLNTIFGTNINSMELMMETDPTKRMKMLRKELVDSGNEWDNLEVFQKNVITSTLGIDEAQAALMLSSEKERKKLKAEKAEREKTVKTNEDWNKGLTSIKKTLIAWGPVVDKTMRAIANLISRIMGFDGAKDPVLALAKGIGKMADEFTNFVDSIDEEKIYTLQNVFITTKDILSDLWSVLKVGGGILIDLVLAPFKLFDNMLDQIGKNLVAVYDLFLDLTSGRILSGFKDFVKAINPLKQLENVFSGLGKWTGKALGLDSVDDALITSSGKVIELNPKDNVLAMQGDPSKMIEMFQGQSTLPDFSQIMETLVAKTPTTATGEAVNNVSAVVAKEISSLAKAIEGLVSATGTAATTPTGSTKSEIIQVNLHLDGKKISESQVRISRNA